MNKILVGALAILMMAGKLFAVQESWKHNQVDMTADERLDGVATGKSYIVSARVAAYKGGEPEWDIVILRFENDDSTGAVSTSVYRTARSGALMGDGGRLVKWVYGKYLEFDVVGSPEYRLTFVGKNRSDGSFYWDMNAEGTYKDIDSAPVQKYELVQTKTIKMKFNQLETVDSSR